MNEQVITGINELIDRITYHHVSKDDTWYRFEASLYLSPEELQIIVVALKHRKISSISFQND